MFDMIVKRDGRKVEFDKNKIVSAALSAFEDAGYKGAEEAAAHVTEAVIAAFSAKYGSDLTDEQPSTEEIQDMVETQHS